MRFSSDEEDAFPQESSFIAG